VKDLKSTTLIFNSPYVHISRVSWRTF